MVRRSRFAPRMIRITPPSALRPIEAGEGIIPILIVLHLTANVTKVPAVALRRGVFFMDPLQPLRIGVQLGNLHSTVEPSDCPLWPTYLWTVFFKIDGDTVNVGADFFLRGHATVVSTSGDHGDLGPNTELAGDIPIPRRLG